MSLENTDPQRKLSDKNISKETEKQGKEAQQHKKRKRKFSWFRFFGRLFFTLGVLLGIIYLIAYFYFNAYLRKEMIRLVSVKTDSLYTLKIHDIGVNLFTSSIQLKQAHLYKNNTKWARFRQRYPDSTYLDIDARLDKFKITGIHWFHFLKTSEIKIKKIIFQRPRIKFRSKPKKKARYKKPPPKPVHALMKVLRKIASHVVVEQIKIEEGQIDLLHKQRRGAARHQATKIDIQVDQIRLNPTPQLPDSQAVKVAGFSFRATKYRFTTPDQVYEIALQQLKLSSHDSTLQLAGVQVTPQFAEENRLVNLKTHKATFVNVSLDSLIANRVDFYRLITQKEIDLGAVFMHHLQLELSQDKRMPNQIRQKKQNLKQLLAKIPIYIRADTLALENASFVYKQKLPAQNNTHNIAHKADSIYLYLRQVALGKAADSAIKEKLLFSESVDLEMHHYQHLTPDGLYKISLDKAFLSSRRSLVSIQNASLKPLTSRQEFTIRKFYQAVMVDAEVESLNFTNLDIESLVYHQRFIMRGLYINKPRFKAYSDKRRPKRPQQKYQNFEQMLQSLPLHIEVDTFAIKDASLEYVEQQPKDSLKGNGLATHTANQLNVLVQSIQLGKALRSSALAELDTKSLRVGVKNYRFKTSDGLYELHFNDLEVSSAKAQIEIDSLSLKPLLSDSAFVHATTYRKPLLSIALSNLKAKEVNFDKLLLYQQIDWGKLYLNRPILDVFVDKRKPKKPTPKPDIPDTTLLTDTLAIVDTTSLQKVLRNLPLFIKIDTFAIKDARLSYREQIEDASEHATGVNAHQVKQFNCMIPQIRLGKASVKDSIQYDFYSPHIVVKLDDYEFREKNSVYKFSLKNVQSSFTDSQLLIKDVHLQPLITQEEFDQRQKFRKPLWTIDLRSIRAREIDLEKLIFERKIDLNTLSFDRPNIDMYVNKLKAKDTVKVRKTIHEALQRTPVPVHIDSVLIYQANFKMRELGKIGESHHLAQDISVIAQQFTLDEDSIVRSKSKDLLFTKDIFVKMSQYRFITPDNIHEVSFHNMAAALNDSSLQINHLSMKPKVSEALFDSIKQFRALRTDAELATFQAKHIDFRRLFDGEGFAMKQLMLNKLHLDLYQNNNLPRKAGVKPKNLQQLIAQIPIFISIDSLTLRNSSVNLRLIKKNKILRHQADSISLDIRNFRVNKALRNNPTIQKVLFADDVSFKLNNYRTKTPNEVYNIHAKQISGSTFKKNLILDKITLKSPLTEQEFKDHYQVQQDRFKINTDRIKFNNIAYNHLIRHGQVKIRSVNIKRMFMDIFRDRREPPNPRKVLMPNQQIKKIPFLLTVDTIKMANSFVMYGEKVPGGIGFGQVFFSEINARVTNLRSRGSKSTMTTIRANTRLMGRGFLETTIKIPLLAPEFKCAYQGQMGEMEAKFFNTMITANDHIFIKRGRIRKVKFQVTIKDSLATGQLLAGYRKLRIQVLRKKNHQRKRGFITFIANLIIKHTNNLTKKRYKKGKVKYQFRKKGEYKNGFIGILWRALSTGLVDTIK
ncbi:hypothetical protein [uncultured Microscilla sp.]|uniref:hypothetical protein n=1 Tax=uncultured Microscilla sp. TaxID=432653 RepID=UPI002608F1E9|nr:hypothetical protein [uncultured Microscilla sp.]